MVILSEQLAHNQRGHAVGAVDRQIEPLEVGAPGFQKLQELVEQIDPADLAGRGGGYLLILD